MSALAQYKSFLLTARLLIYYFARGRGAKYCDEYICLSVCLLAHITCKPHGRTSPNFSCMLPMTVARFSSNGFAVSCFFPVLWMTSYFHTTGRLRVICITKQPEQNSRNDCIDSDRILLNNGDEQVHIVGCAPGRSLPSTVAQFTCCPCTDCGIGFVELQVQQDDQQVTVATQQVLLGQDEALQDGHQSDGTL